MSARADAACVVLDGFAWASPGTTTAGSDAETASALSRSTAKRRMSGGAVVGRIVMHVTLDMW
jgi:hypothetical protein